MAMSENTEEQEMTGYRTPDDHTIEEAYVYLLGRAFVIRQEHTDSAADGFNYNTIRYNPLGSSDFVNPNLDVAYLEAWIAVDDDTAVLLEVPEITGRYYTAQILDEWGEVIVNINERATPSKPAGTFALVKPGTNPPIPEGATRIELHSAKAKMLARVELGDDPEGAVWLQHAFTVRALTDVRVAEPPALPAFDNASLLDVRIFDLAEDILASALDVSPVAARLQTDVRAVAAHVASSAEARAAVGELLREHVIPGFRQYAVTESAPKVNHWIGGGRVGVYASDYRLRSSANYIGIWANTAEEVVYFVGSRDSDQRDLDGSKHYAVHFPADGLPETVVDGYWSIILVSVPDYRVVPNDFDRYNLNSYSPIERNTDGSLTIGAGPGPIDDVPEANRLPSASGKPFSLTFRAYVPKEFAIGGSWGPPAVTEVP
jgi:hypothetical protein